MKLAKQPKDMTLEELKKALPLEEKRAANLRAYAEANPDMGFGWVMAAKSANKNALEMVRLIQKKSSKTHKKP